MNRILTVGSLFSGIGGIDLGLERTGGFKIAWQVEIDPYCQKVLAKHWPDVARYGDIRECGKHNLSAVDLICGGFPCQDISIAGKRAGIEGSRSGLWSEFYRLICELRPSFVLVENVPALLNWGMERVLGDLAACGYDAEWQCISAASIGAPHVRERVFIVSYATSRTRELQQSEWQDLRDKPAINGKTGHTAKLADADRQGLAVGQVFGSYARQELPPSKRSHSTGTGQWAVEPSIRRVVNGFPHRVDRLRGLGNAVVPQVAQFIGECILQAVEAESEGVA